MLKVREYSSSSRMSDDDYAGVLVHLGGGVRLSVNPAGNRYALQRSALVEGVTVWAGTSYARLSTLISKQGGTVDGLAVACDGLPDDPALAAPDLQAARQSVLDAFQATDWRRDDYPLVLCVDGSLRLVIASDGSEYRLQWLSIAEQYSDTPRNNWRTVKVSSIAPPLIGCVRNEVYDIQDGPFSRDKDPDLIAPDLQKVISSLPFRASDYQMPDRLERPATVW